MRARAREAKRWRSPRRCATAASWWPATGTGDAWTRCGSAPDAPECTTGKRAWSPGGGSGRRAAPPAPAWDRRFLHRRHAAAESGGIGISGVEGIDRSTRASTPSDHGESDMAKKGQEPLVIVSKAKSILKKSGCNTAGDAFQALNGYLYWLLEQAAKRAKANGRKTVRPHDFMV